MNAAPPAPPMAEPQPGPTIESTPTSEKARYSPQLYEFLDALSQNYAESGDSQKAAEITEARESLEGPHPPAAALAEVFLFSSSWELQLQALEQHANPDQVAIDEAETAANQSRLIFMEACKTTYPYIPLIAREEVDPSSEKALSDVDHKTNDLIVRIEQSMAKKASSQLNIDVEQVYRLQMLRDQLEKEIRQGSSPKLVAAPLRESAPAAPAPEKTTEQVRAEAAAHWQRLGLDQHMQASLDQWIEEGLLRDPDIDLFGNDLDKWRSFDTAIRDLRHWYGKLETSQKNQSYPELIGRINEILKQF